MKFSACGSHRKNSYDNDEHTGVQYALDKIESRMIAFKYRVSQKKFPLLKIQNCNSISQI